MENDGSFFEEIVKMNILIVQIFWKGYPNNLSFNKYIFWIPLSFLLGLFFNENFSNNISFDDIVILSTGVLTLALIFIGVAIVFFLTYLISFNMEEESVKKYYNIY